MERSIPRSIIRYIVSHMHVDTSNRAVIEDLRGRFCGDSWTKERRKKAYRYAIEVHNENRNLYACVVKGKA